MKSTALSVPLLRYFQTQIRFLGGLWIFFGVIVAFAAIVCIALMALARPNVPQIIDERKLLPLDLLIVLLATLAVVWITIGAFTCFKVMPAVYAGLVLCYLFAVTGLLTWNVCSVIIFGLAIFLAHRVIWVAGKLNQAGIPLTANPSDPHYFN